jgi:hypothetical protein
VSWSRQQYLDTAISRGVPRQQAEQLADGLMAAHERVRKGMPGWERLCMETPQAVIDRYIWLFDSAVASNPTPSVPAAISSGVAAAFGYGVFVGMLLAEAGVGPNEAEREAGAKNMPEIQAWVDALRAEAQAEAEARDDA